MEIVHADYEVQYDEASSTVTCRGSFRLHWLEKFEGQFSLPLDL
jgi:hypothetical protein